MSIQNVARILTSINKCGEVNRNESTVLLGMEFAPSDFEEARKNNTLAFDVQTRHAVFGRILQDFNHNPLIKYNVVDMEGQHIGQITNISASYEAFDGRMLRKFYGIVEWADRHYAARDLYLLPMTTTNNLSDRRIEVVGVHGFMASTDYVPARQLASCFESVDVGNGMVMAAIVANPLSGAFIYTDYADNDPRTMDIPQSILDFGDGMGQPRTLVLHHADSDGRFAGYAAWRYLQEQAPQMEHVFHEVQYGQDFPVPMESLLKTDTVYILDFSYKRDILEQVKERVGKLQVLDHHKSAASELQGLPYAHFDMSKSGALLAWEYFFPQEQPPHACVLVNDRDLWAKQYPDSRLFEAYLRMERVGSDWKKWHQLATDREWLEVCIAKGQVACTVEDAMIAKVFNSNIHKLIDFHINGRRISTAVYNCPGLMHSEVAEYYYTHLDVDMTMGWRVVDGKIIFSLRSPSRVDVSEVARILSGGTGGGHAAAAGFSRTIEGGFSFLTNILK